MSSDLSAARVRSRGRIAVEVLLAGWVHCGLFASAASSLGPMALVQPSYWIAALGSIGVGVLLALLVIELRLLVVEVVLAAIAATAFYGLLLVSAIPGAPSFAVRLTNFALVQMVPVFFLSLFLGLIGALVGTMINSSARGYEL